MTKIESEYKEMMEDVQMSDGMIAHAMAQKALELERERDNAIEMMNRTRDNSGAIIASQVVENIMLTQERDKLAEALEQTLNATVLNHRNDRWHIDAEHSLQLIKTK